MIDGISLEQIKQYNNSIKQYQDKAAHIRAGIEYSTNEINRLCKELTTELGVEVTPSNIRMIYAERVDKIKNMLMVGTGILERIRQEEEAATQGAVQPMYTPEPVQQIPVPSMGDTLAPPTAPAAPNLGFDSIGAMPGGLEGIPPIFQH